MLFSQFSPPCCSGVNEWLYGAQPLAELNHKYTPYLLILERQSGQNNCVLSFLHKVVRNLYAQNVLSESKSLDLLTYYICMESWRSACSAAQSIAILNIYIIMAFSYLRNINWKYSYFRLDRLREELQFFLSWVTLYKLRSPWKSS